MDTSDFTVRIAFGRDHHLTVGHGLSVASLLSGRAASRGDHPFLVWQPHDAEARTWSYAAMEEAARRCGAGLGTLGVRPGHRIAIVMGNRPEFLISWFGAAYAHAVAVTLNTRSSAEELTYYLEHSAATLIITDEDHAENVRSVAGDRTVVVAGTASWREHFDAAEAAPAPPVRAPLEIASVMYTSGSSARPKAVLWTEANCLWSARVNASHEGLRDTDRHLVTLPLFHANALAYSVLASLWAGATVVLTPSFSARRFWPVALEHRCTWASMVSFTYQVLSTQPVPEGHFFRRWGNSYSVPAGECFAGVEVMGWYGMTETVSHPMCSDLLGETPRGAVGRPCPEYGVAVLDGDGVPVTVGEGELVVRGVPGVSLFAGYARDPEATNACYDAEGWFHTGDIVSVGEGGHLTFVRRAKDMLKVGGENVAAAEVERALAGHPGIREAAVVPVTDEVRGELPVAFVTVGEGARPAPSDLKDWCAQRLADFKVPREIHFVDALPRNAAHKIDKPLLRARARQGVTQTEQE